jgi:hypothetical protein
VGRGRYRGNGAGRVSDSSTIVLRRQFPWLGPSVAPRTPTEQKFPEISRKALGMDQLVATVVDAPTIEQLAHSRISGQVK